MLKSCKIIIWLIVILSVSQILEARDFKLDLVLSNEIDYCEDDDRFTFILDMGEIVQDDSLYLYQFSIKYDLELLSISTVLTANTLSEFFEKDVKYSNGEVYGSIGDIQFGPPTTGDKPLVGFTGRFNGNCQDSALIYINYFEFSKEFTGNLDKSDTLIVRPRIEKLENVFSIETDSTQYHFTDDSIKTITFNRIMNDTKKNVSEISGEIEISDKVNYEVLEVTNINSDLIDFEYEINSEFVNFNTSFADNSDVELFDIVLKAKNISPINDATLSISCIVNDECTCVSNPEIKTISLLNDLDFTEDTTSVDEKFENYFQTNNVLYIKSDEFIKNAQLYSLTGNLLSSISVNSRELNFDKTNLTTGAYFMTIQLNNEEKIISIFKY